MTAGCRWDGTGRDATVRYRWDPRASVEEPEAPWLPRSLVAISDASSRCVPVSLDFEIIDAAGQVRSATGSLPTPDACDIRAVDRSETGRVVYLDPSVPPRQPGRLRAARFRSHPPSGRAEYGGDIRWRDASDNEDGYRVYARRNWLEADCSISRGRQVLIETLPPNTKRYTPRHQRIMRRIPAPAIEDVPGEMRRYELFVAAFNEAGESRRVYVDGFVLGDSFCGGGLELPPDE